jgi:tetratricopeptide (TPR) repeat protein
MTRFGGFSFVRTVCAAALVAGFACAAPAQARQDDPRLDPLFDSLKEAQSPEQARLIETGIWRIWHESGSDTIDLLLENGNRAMAVHAFDKALGLFDAAIDMDPDLAEAWNRRATLYFMMGDYASSVRDIQKTLMLEPRHFGALSGLGLIYDALENEAGAFKAYRKALSINPNLPRAKERVRALKKAVEGEAI